MMRSSLLLLVCLTLVMLAGEADAEKEPLWSYTTGDDVRSVAISADGEYIAAGSEVHKTQHQGQLRLQRSLALLLFSFLCKPLFPPLRNR